MATFHHDFLSGAEHRAHYEGLGFREKVEQRLQDGEREYGDSYRTKATGKMLREIREECFDVAAWSSLLAETLPDRGLDGDQLSNARLLLQEIAALGVMGDQLVSALAELTG
jgi:hypothetical protein